MREYHFTETAGLAAVPHFVPVRSIGSAAEVEWAVKALTNLIQVLSLYRLFFWNPSLLAVIFALNFVCDPRARSLLVALVTRLCKLKPHLSVHLILSLRCCSPGIRRSFSGRVAA
jgi:hypothetical protein